MNIIGIIPARLNSKRLREKLLIKIKNRTILEYVLANAMKIRSIKQLYVATDSPRIRKVIEKAGGKVIMTPASCKSGTERIKAALKAIKANINDIIVNIQGDEPLLEPLLVEKLIQALVKEKKYDVATLAAPMKEPKEIMDPSNVKVVVGSDNNALYFSRAVIPFPRDKGRTQALKHLGVYAYRKWVLDRWDKFGSKYEKIEKLEQLRMIENNCAMKVIIGKSRSISLDTKHDLIRIRRAMRG